MVKFSAQSVQEYNQVIVKCVSDMLYYCSGNLLESSLSLSLSQLTEIMQLMNAYFSATHRQLGKDDCISMETNPKLRPSLLELPSHPV